MGDLRANPARDLAFQESIKEGHLWECESFYSGWDAAMAYAEEAVKQERERLVVLARQQIDGILLDSEDVVRWLSDAFAALSQVEQGSKDER